VAQEIREFAVTIPAMTPKSAPLVTPIIFPNRIVVAVSYHVPPGPSGLMGWALTSAGTPVIPIQPNTFLVTNDRSDTWDLEGYLDSGNWAVTGYNTGIYPHTVYLTFQLDLPGADVTPPSPPTGVGVGVVGTGGTVDTGTTPPDGGGSTTAPPVDDSPSVISVVLAALAAQLT
jgi:hypothetical protein